MTTPIGQSIGRYHVIEQLGEGGMATVYKAFDTRLDREVAIKIIRRGKIGTDDMDHLLKRFEREAKSLAQLSHPNIVKVYDYGEFEGSPYLVMEYLPGGTLKQRLGTPFAPAEAVRLLIPMARALDYAHQRKIIHRDVKPANILITESGEPMLSDFGIAKILEDAGGMTLTGVGVGIGTPDYMAPEQWVNKVVPQTDIYALGIVLYEMIAGRRPYTADTPAAVLLKQVQEPLPRPRVFVPGLPDEVERILFKALAKQADDRFASMAVFATAMETLLQSAGRPAEPARRPAGVDRPPEKARAEAAARPVATPKPPQPVRPTPPVAAQKKVDLTGMAREEIVSARKKGRMPAWVWIIGGLVLIFLLLLGGAGTLALVIGNTTGARNAAATNTALWSGFYAEQTAAVGPTASMPRPSATTPKVTPTPPEPGAVSASEMDGMTLIYVPAGEFLMGAPEGGDASFDEKPQHTVYLDAFWIDKTEVANAQYAKCARSGGCTPPIRVDSQTRPSYYDNSEYANYPVIYVTWDQALAYCQWAGRRLPTEAEWEKAARGTDGRLYPWGNETPGGTRINLDSKYADTTAAGKYPAGASAYGTLDMAGNVWEWVSDWYAPDYYASSPAQNPAGPDSGTERGLRGGAWSSGIGVRATDRYSFTPATARNTIGFRCAANP